MTPRTRRMLGGAALVFAGLAVGFAIAVWATLDGTLPPCDGEIRLAGLDGPIEITFDSMGVAQVWAETAHDGLFGLGWLHVADRLFQADFTRHVAQGRLSELLGAATAAFDSERRRDGHARLARAALAKLSPENQARLQAYADGINAYRARGRRPLEYLLLRTEAEEWRVYDCLTVLSFMTWYSDALQNRDHFFAELVREGRAGVLDSLPLGYPSGALPPGCGERAEAAGRLNLGGGAEAFTPARSSNAWAVAPARSASGKAIFCSDPHLELTRLPQFWYAVGLHTRRPQLDAVGVTIPGLPFVVMGHNGQAAWAFTAGGVDLVDYYVERVNPGDPEEYLERIDPARGADSLVWSRIEVVRDTVAIAGSDSGAVIQLRFTRHGAVDPEWSGRDSLVVCRWAGLEADLDRAATAGWELMQTRTFAEFRGAVTAMGALNANWLYADAGGTIGYQLGSPVPRRGEASPYAPLAGWAAEDDWKGYLSGDERPWCENPPEGWLANCNNRTAERPDIPGSYAIDRIVRIEALLRSQERFTADDMRRFQLDRIDAYALRWKGLIDSVGAAIGDTTGALAAVASWDGSADAASRAAGLVRVFLMRLGPAVFADELGEGSEGLGTAAVDQVFFGGDSTWLDDRTTAGRIENRYEIAGRALREALDIARGRTWGEMQTLQMRHPMADAPVIGGLIDLAFGPWPWGGTSGTLNSSFCRQPEPGRFETIVGPSWRFILDFADVEGALMVLPAGNSGHPLSPHFFDFNESWRNGRYWNVPIGRDRVYRRAASLLRLAPGDTVQPGSERSSALIRSNS